MKFFISILLALAVTAAYAQEINRSFLTVMVIPYTTEGNAIAKFENDPAYRAAIGEINNALIKLGYSNTLDLREQRALIDKFKNRGSTQNDDLKELIQELPADIVIEAELEWIESGEDKQVRVALKAIDKHTATLYANNPGIRSQQRNFLNLQEAVEAALRRDGKKQFEAFLEQMEASLLLGRQVPFRFEVATVTPLNYKTIIEGKPLMEWVKDALAQHGKDQFYRITGESANLIQGFSIEPIIDAQGFYIQPCSALCSGVGEFMRGIGINMQYDRVGKQTLFRLEGELQQTK